MKGHSLLGIIFHGRWSRQASGRLIKVKYTGNSLGGSETVVRSNWSFKRGGRLQKFDCILSADRVLTIPFLVVLTETKLPVLIEIIPLVLTEIILEVLARIIINPSSH